MNVVAEKINQELKQHQINAEDWDYKEDIEKLHLWSKRLILGFKLESFLPVIRIAKFKRGTSGCFRDGRNGFGLLNEIGINQEIINKCDYWEVLGVLLHLLLHSEQYNIGNQSEGTYHNRKFRDRAKKIGLLVDTKGLQKYISSPTTFINLLRDNQVDIPDTPVGILPLSGQSKSKLWICQCQPRPVHVRVAIKRFRARCLDCNQLFKPEQCRKPGKKSSDHLGKQSTNTIPTGTGFIYTRSNSNKKQQICKGVEQCKG